MPDYFKKEIAVLGIENSPAFVRAPAGIGCDELFIRTIKENILLVRRFEAIEELRQAMLASRGTGKTTWLIKRHVCYAGRVPSEAASTTRGGVGRHRTVTTNSENGFNAVCDQEFESGVYSAWLPRGKRLEQLVSDVRGNAGAAIVHADFALSLKAPPSHVRHQPVR